MCLCNKSLEKELRDCDGVVKGMFQGGVLGRKCQERGRRDSKHVEGRTGIRAWGRTGLSKAGSSGRSGLVGSSIGSGRDDRIAMTDGMVEVTQDASEWARWHPGVS